MSVWYSLWLFAIFPHLGMFGPGKIWQPWYEDTKKQPKTKNRDQNQCCQMVYFQTKDPNLGKFWTVLQWKMLVFFTAIVSTLRPNVIFWGNLVHLVVIWYIFPILVYLYQEKSGNPYQNGNVKRGFYFHSSFFRRFE
jgi:hypothetical protein